MKQQTLNQRGFGAVELVIVIALIAAVGGLGWYSWQARESSNENIVVTEDNSEQKEEAKPVVVKTGTFKNVGEKTGSGQVSLVKNSDKTYTVRLEESFTVQNGPALFVAFGNGEQYAEGTAFSELKSFSGKQEYRVPANIDPSKYTSVIIWCDEFSVAFAAADLK